MAYTAFDIVHCWLNMCVYHAGILRNISGGIGQYN